MSEIATLQEKEDYLIMDKIEAQVDALLKRINDFLDKLCENLPYRTYDSGELEKMLGVSKKTLGTYRSKGLLRYRQINGKIYYLRTDIDEFHEKNIVTKLKPKF